MPIYETGHARNVQHFEELVTYVTSWGVSYDPSNPALELLALTAKLTAAKASMNNVLTSKTDWTDAVNSRENIFDGVRKLVTRCVNYYDSTGPEENQMDDVRSLKRKLDGQRAKTKDDVEPPAPGDPVPPDNEISASQQSYTQIVEHFDGLIKLFEKDANYAPNEAALTTVSLNAKLTAMKGANTSVIAESVNLANDRGVRNDTMYTEDTGLVDIALLVKKYTRAAFGTDSTQFGEIKGLEFTKPRK